MIVPYTAISQNLKPIIKVDSGKTLFCFDSVQTNFLRKKLELIPAQTEKIQLLELQNKSLEFEIDAREKAFLSQHEELKNQKTIVSLREKQINEYVLQVNAYKKSDRRAKVGKVFYKSLTFILAGTVFYLAIKK